ncbi:MAG: hypothetical protein ABI671_06245 [Burkholderiales bacterium]
MNADAKRVQNIIERYLSMWNESDPDRRHEIVKGLWADDGENVSRRFDIRGVDEIVRRVDQAHTDWVQSKGFIFKAAGAADSHNHLILLPWEMAPRKGGMPEARGTDVFVLNGDGRIQSLYHFAALAQTAATT